jgi:15-cis-phytoene synthase
MSMNEHLDAAFTYCLRTLRDLDRDRYLACLLMPDTLRRDMAPLYLFNAEIARIRDLVHEPLPGEVRLQWWRDLFEAPGQGEHAGALAEALFDVIGRHNLPRQVFINMLDARIFDLYDDPMESRNDFEGYAGETASAVIQLGLLIAAPDESAALAEAAGHAGVAQAVAGALLLMPRHAARGQVYLPVDMQIAAGLDRDKFINRTEIARIDTAIEMFAAFGLDHFDKARRAGKPGSKSIQPFLAAALAKPVLLRALKVRSGLLDAPLMLGQLQSQWHLWRTARRGTL